MQIKVKQLEKYDVTLWRHPSAEREGDKVNESFFYFTVYADSEQDAIAEAKKDFPHSVWESYATLA